MSKSDTTIDREFNADGSDVAYDSGEGDTAATNALATLSEEKENRVQLDKIRRMTVEQGVMKLPVSAVETAENSEQWVLKVGHPVEGDHRLFFEKPLHGYSREYKIARLLDWYDVEDPYDLEWQSIYVTQDEEEADRAHGWYATPPPNYDPPIKVQLKEKWDTIQETNLPRPNSVYGFLFIGAIAGPLFHGTLPALPIFGQLAADLLTSAILFGVCTILGLMARDVS